MSGKPTTEQKKRKGMVMTNLKNLNKDFSDFRNAFGGHQIVLVDQMQAPLMIPNECHHNVTKKQLVVADQFLVSLL